VDRSRVYQEAGTLRLSAQKGAEWRCSSVSKSTLELRGQCCRKSLSEPPTHLLMHSLTGQMSSMAVMLKIQVVFASPENQLVIDLEVREGTTIAAAVEQSGLRDELRAVGIDIDALTFGVWNKVRSGDDFVSDGDRVELYRTLEVDPKEARRRRADPDAS